VGRVAQIRDFSAFAAAYRAARRHLADVAEPSAAALRLPRLAAGAAGRLLVPVAVCPACRISPPVRPGAREKHRETMMLARRA
jgi:hypothetical protein